MNEKIRELLARCQTESIDGPEYPRYVDQEKFAELIVRECAAYADEMWPHQKEFKGQLNIGQGIRRKFDVPNEHLGVKE